MRDNPAVCLFVCLSVCLSVGLAQSARPSCVTCALVRRSEKANNQAHKATWASGARTESHFFHSSKLAIWLTSKNKAPYVRRNRLVSAAPPRKHTRKLTMHAGDVCIFARRTVKRLAAAASAQQLCTCNAAATTTETAAAQRQLALSLVGSLPRRQVGKIERHRGGSGAASSLAQGSTFESLAGPGALAHRDAVLQRERGAGILSSQRFFPHYRCPFASEEFATTLSLLGLA